MKPSIEIVLIAILLMLAGCGKPESKTAEKVEEKSEAAHSEIQRAQITAEAARNAGIAVSVVGQAALKETLSLYGVVVPNAEHVRTVVARFPGVVKSVNKSLGDHVQTGDILATVESNDSLQTYPIKAPIAGVITARDINAGESVAEKPLFTITDLSTVWVELSLFPRDRARVRVGQTVDVKTTQGRLNADGKINWLAAVGTTATQSLIARVALDNKQNTWTPGLYVVGDITLGEQPVALAVQSAALQTLDGKTVVFVETQKGFDARPVQIGRSDDERTEILSGLVANERYVSANSFVIKADIEKSSADHDD